MQTEFSGTLAHVIDLPYTPLSPAEREQTQPLAAQIVAKVRDILGESGERMLPIDARRVRRLHVGYPEALPGRIYDGAEVVVEVLQVDGTDTLVGKESSFGFYPGVVISRPNVEIVQQDEIEAARQRPPVNHEATLGELQSLLRDIEGAMLEDEEYLL